MAIPDTDNGWGLQDVVTELGMSGLPGDDHMSVINEKLVQSFAITSPGDEINDCAFNLDGTELYVLTQDARIQTHTFGTPYDVTTLVWLTSHTFGQGGDMFGFWFKPDGMSVYVIADDPSDNIVQWDMTSPFAISTMVSVGTTAELNGNQSGIEISADGTRVWTIAQTDDNLNEYALSTPWDITTLTHTVSIALTGSVSARFFRWMNEGFSLLVTDVSVPYYIQYDCTTAYDLSTKGTEFYSNISPNGNSTGIALIQSRGQFIVINTDIFVADKWGLNIPGGNSLVDAFDTAKGKGFDPAYIGNQDRELNFRNYVKPSMSAANATIITDFVLINNERFKGALWFHPDGTWFYVLRDQGVNERYDLTTAWDISTASFTDTVAFENDTNNEYGLDFNLDGTLAIVNMVRSNDDRDVLEYGFTTPWDTSTSTGAHESIPSGGDIPNNIKWIPDGTKYQMTDASNQYVRQYSVPTPFILLGATNTVVFELNGLVSGDVNGHFWSPDGMQLFIYTKSSPFFYHYNAVTPWDLTGMSTTAVANSGSTAFTTSGFGMVARPGTTEAYLLRRGDETGNVYQIDFGG